MPDTSEYGSITVFVDFYFKKRFLKTFPESFFYPRPTISSSLIELTRRPELDVNQEDFFRLVRSSFTMRRKKIVNNLKDSFSCERVVDALKSIGLDRDVRAERLSLNDFVALYKELH
jgi:16S rRNA (adenine1518-N6/adenine1519-N6)-dimethyltransferase